MLTNVGSPFPRIDGEGKVTGRVQYAADIYRPGLLYVRVLRSPLPHARLRRIDTRRAEALPGVYAVLSASNAPEIVWYQENMLFDCTVQFVGDEIAAVAAATEEIAEDALRLIDVEYEALPFVTDLEEALHPEAPPLRESGNMAGEPTIYQRSDPGAGFQEADVIIDATYTTQTALHNCLEPHGCPAAWEGNHLTLWDPTQAVFDVRHYAVEDQNRGVPYTTAGRREPAH